jgi:hypothetical protein
MSTQIDDEKKRKRLIRGIVRMNDTITSIRFFVTNNVEVVPNYEWIGGSRCPVWYEKEHYRIVPKGHLPIIRSLGLMLRDKVVSEMKTLWFECQITNQLDGFSNILKKHLGSVCLQCGLIMHDWLDDVLMNVRTQRTVSNGLGSTVCFDQVMNVFISMSNTWFYSAIGAMASVRGKFTDLGMRFLEHDVFLWANGMPSYELDDVVLDEDILG